MRKKTEWIDANKKLFVLNSCKKVNTLHINDGRCRHVKGLAKWADFETEQSAVKFANNNLKRCRTCFQQD